MDETTHPFSRKVLDRANTIEFDKAYLKKSFEKIMEASKSEFTEKTSIGENLTPEFINLRDMINEYNFIDKTNEIEEINTILEKGNFNIGYRVRDEMCMYMTNNRKYDLLDENIAFDYQLLQKILPRIQGSTDRVKKVLVELVNYTIGGKDINIKSDDYDLINTIEKEIENRSIKYKKSTAKLVYMLRRFEEEGFTSYWL